MAKPTITKEINTFYKGRVYHLDQFYNIQAFVMPHSIPVKSKGVSEYNYNPDTSDNHKMLKTVKVEIKVTTY
jgi:hypothetical protein